MAADTDIKFECIVSADLFARAHLGVSKEWSRYYLNGVHVSPCPEGGAILTATDGAMLISVRDPDAHVTGEAIVSLDRAMVKALTATGVQLAARLVMVRIAEGGRAKAFVVNQPVKRAQYGGESNPYDDCRTLFSDPDARVVAAQFGEVWIDGTFPNWRQVIPTKLRHDGVPPAIDASKLASISKAICNRRSSGLVMTPTGDDPANSPLLITAESRGREAFAILMPLRVGDRKDEVPSWAKPASVKKAA